MRLIQAAAAIALIAIAIAILGVTVINAKPTTQPATATMSVSRSIDVIRMMIDAKDLPMEQFDAH